MQIFCNVIMFLNLAVATGLLIFDLVRLPKKCEKISSMENADENTLEKYRKQAFKRFSKNKYRQLSQIKDDTIEKYKKIAFQNTLSYIMLKLLPFMAISIVTCIFDGINGILPGDGEQPYIPIFIIAFLISAVVLTAVLRIYFSFLKDKYKFNYEFQSIYSRNECLIVPMGIGLIHGVVIAQAIYTIVLMCIL